MQIHIRTAILITVLICDLTVIITEVHTCKLHGLIAIGICKVLFQLPVKSICIFPGYGSRLLIAVVYSPVIQIFFRGAWLVQNFPVNISHKLPDCFLHLFYCFFADGKLWYLIIAFVRWNIAGKFFLFPAVSRGCDHVISRKNCFCINIISAFFQLRLFLRCESCAIHLHFIANGRLYRVIGHDQSFRYHTPFGKEKHFFLFLPAQSQLHTSYRGVSFHGILCCIFFQKSGIWPAIPVLFLQLQICHLHWFPFMGNSQKLFFSKELSLRQLQIFVDTLPVSLQNSFHIIFCSFLWTKKTAAGPDHACQNKGHSTCNPYIPFCFFA